MAEPTNRIDPELLAEALRDVVGEGAEGALLEGTQSVAHLVRRLLANPQLARELLAAISARAIKRRFEDEPPLEFGQVATDSGTYADPPLMLDPVGSPEFEAAIDAMVRLNDQKR